MKRIILFLLLLPAVLGQVCQTVENDQPTITAEFNDEEYGVRITDAELRRDGGGVYDEDNLIIQPQGYNTTFDILPDVRYLLSDNYTLSLTAEDRVENANTTNYCFQVDVPFSIYLDQPSFGVSSTSPYDVIVSTSEDAHCAWSENSQADFGICRSDPEHCFDGEDVNTYQATHRLSNITWGETSPEEIYIICETNTEYLSKPYTFNVDTTPPEIDVTADPNPLIDNTNSDTRTTDITIETNERSICELYDEAHDETIQLYQSTIREEAYQTEHTTSIEYFVNGDYDNQITCTNMAGLEGEANHTVSVEYDDTFYINITEPTNTYVSSDFDLTATTPDLTTADCRYEIGNRGGDMSDTGEDHTARVENVDDGQHTIDVICDALGGQETASTTVTVDSTPPTNTELTVTGAGCAGTAQASFSADDPNGISHYEYQAYPQGGSQTGWNETIRSSVTINGEPGSTYIVRMRAVDAAGNEGDTVTKTIEFDTQDTQECDTNPPTITVSSYQNRDESQEVYTVQCSDDEGPCQDQYAYYTGPGTSCGDPQGQNDMNDELPVAYDNLVCIWVYDQSDNTDRYVDQAKPQGIYLIDPQFGVSDETPYNITFGTSKETFCSSGFLEGQPNEPPYVASDEEGSFTTTHYTEPVTWGEDQPRRAYFRCTNREDETIERGFDFSVDTTPPQVTTQAEPALVTDFQERHSNLTVTTDDPSVCWIQGRDTDQIFPGEAENIQDTYGSNHDIFLNYSDITDVDRHEFTYDIRCKNLAGLETTTQQTITVELTSNFAIDVTRPEGDYTNADPVTVELDTGLQTICRLDGTRSDLATTHTYNLGSLNEDTYQYTASCFNDQSNEEEPVQFIVDRTPPQNTSIDPDNACDMDILTASFSATDDNGIAGFNYSVSSDGQRLTNWTFVQSTDATVVVNVTPGTTYTWNARAIDTAGNPSNPATATITARGPDDVLCDDIPPQLNLTASQADGGKTVSVTCSDDGSGCRPNYNYSLIDKSATCETPNQTNPLSSTVFLDYNSKVCVWVYDEAGNERGKHLTTAGATPEDCGNGQLDPGEFCDGNALGGATCQQVGDFSGGTLSCTDQCTFDTTACNPSDDQGATCGDGEVNQPGEQCDGDDYGPVDACTDYTNFVGGNLDCTDSCELDTSGCVDVPTCGNGEINEGEDCEPGLFGEIDACTDYEEFTGGQLRCDPNTCQLDTSQCTEAPTCGNGRIDPGETCDGDNFGNLTGACTDYDNSFTGGDLSCTDSCQISTDTCQGVPGGTCGDGVLNVGEECESGNFGNIAACSDIPEFTGGELSCTNCELDTSQCTVGPECGNGYIDQGETCDGDNFDGIDSGLCSDYSSDFETGQLSCTSSCQIDTSSCQEAPTCGNGRIDSGEACDGTNLNGVSDSCSAYSDDFTSGTLSCNDQCQFDTSACEMPDETTEPTCGNGVIENGETCDGDTFGDVDTCSDLDAYSSGILDCNSQCQLDVSACRTPEEDTCGDGVKDSNEQCDGNDFGEISTACTDYSDDFTGGQLSCNDNCQYDTLSCEAPTSSEPTCGDGIIQPSEVCDGDNLNNNTCSSYDGFIDGQLSCDQCEYDKSACEPKPETIVCGNEDAERGESCDGTDLNGVTCTTWPGFTGGDISCTPAGADAECTFDTTACTSNTTRDQVCGNGFVETGEECEPGNLNGFTCSELGFDGGSLSCTDDCTFRTNSCFAEQNDTVGGDINTSDGEDRCGNGVINEGEDCDSGNLGEKIWCDEFGMQGGKVQCTDACRYDTSVCDEAPSPGDQEQPTPVDEGISTIALVILLTGLLSMLGGGGYLGYKEYYMDGITPWNPDTSSPAAPTDDKGRSQGPPTGSTHGPPNHPPNKPPREPTVDEVREEEKKRLLKKIREKKKKKEREELFDEFE